MEERIHTPVLLNNVLELLNPQKGGRYIDATVNGGGHTKEILDRVGDGGAVLGIDRDPTLINRLKNKYIDRKNLIAVCGSYADIDTFGDLYGFGAVNGVLFDLGFSSYHVEQSGRGFSFLRNEPLDMRYNSENTPLTAARIVNSWSQQELARIGKEYGEERFASRVAAAIVRERKHTSIQSTNHLVRVIENAIPKSAQSHRLHPATRIFQALRIAVNDELGALRTGLERGIDMLVQEGIMVVISFHSLEDAIVKEIFKTNKKKGIIRLITPKPLHATSQEIKINPRARSAILRVLIKN